MRKILTTVALFAVIAAPAFGKPLHGSHVGNAKSGQQGATGSYAQAPGATRPNPNSIFEGGRFIGQDPDLAIREELLREDGFEDR
jgi:hypothetical protein